MAAGSSHWSYHNPVDIRFGAGRIADLPGLVRGRRALLITTPGFSRRGVAAQVAKLLAPAQLLMFDQVQPNPDLAQIERLGQELHGQRVEVLVGLGGGSAIDTAKALCVVLVAGAPGALRAHLQGRAALPPLAPLPLIAIPTTAGTGSEVTPFATIWDHQREQKYSLARPDLFAQAALLDPALTVSLPLDVTIATGLDALAQGFEAIWNRNATPITTLYALQAIATAFATLPRLVGDLANLDFRSRMLEASLLAGLAISKTRTALSHSMSYPITAHYGVPHGLACSFTLPALLQFNAAEDDGRLADAASQLGFASIGELHEALRQLLQSLHVDQAIGESIPTCDGLLGLAPHMLTPGRSDNNMRAASVDDVRAILSATTFCRAGERAAGAGHSNDFEYGYMASKDSDF